MEGPFAEGFSTNPEVSGTDRSRQGLRALAKPVADQSGSLKPSEAI
jgi:hypothetical protein